MASTPDAYVLSQAQINLINKIIYQHLRKYVNTKGLPPDDKIDHEETFTPEMYIARTPEQGIPGLTSMGTTGIGDVPGVADCNIFTVLPNAETTEKINTLQRRIYNMSPDPIEGNKWILTTRDKYGRWYAITIGGEGSYSQEHCTRGPGWTAGLSNEDCLLLTVRCGVGKCSTIDETQTVSLSSDDGVIWEGATDFIYSGGSGPVVFTRPDCQALPTLTIDGYCLVYDYAGVDADGRLYIEYTGGTALCSDESGTGSGTGGSRLDCGSNTFTIRLTCFCCVEESITGWDGIGWYCVINTETEMCEPTYLTEANRCDTTITICSGPYVDQSAAEEVCGTVNPICCPDGTAAMKTFKFISGDAFYNPETYGIVNPIPITYKSGSGKWTSNDVPGFDPTGDTGYRIYVELSCSLVFNADLGAFVPKWTGFYSINWSGGGGAPLCGLAANTGLTFFTYCPEGPVTCSATASYTAGVCDPVCIEIVMAAQTLGTCELEETLFIISDNPNVEDCL